MATAAAAISPATSLRLRPASAALRFLSLLTFPTSKPSLSSHPRLSPLILPHRPLLRRRCFYSVVLPSSNEAAMGVEEEGRDGGRVKGLRRRLRVRDINGEEDERLGRVGDSVVVTERVRTIHDQSNVTLIEVETTGDYVIWCIR